MRVVGWTVEVTSFVGAERRQVATYKVPRTRNALRKLTESFQLIAKTFDGFVAFVVVPIINEEAQHEQGKQAAAEVPVSDAGAVRQELGESLSDARTAGAAVQEPAGGQPA